MNRHRRILRWPFCAICVTRSISVKTLTLMIQGALARLRAVIYLSRFPEFSEPSREEARILPARPAISCTTSRSSRSVRGPVRAGKPKYLRRSLNQAGIPLYQTEPLVKISRHQNAICIVASCNPSIAGCALCVEPSRSPRLQSWTHGTNQDQTKSGGGTNRRCRPFIRA